MPTLTFEDKKAIVIEHYQVAYKVKIDPGILPIKIIELYENLIKLQRSQRYHEEKGKAQSFFKIVT